MKSQKISNSIFILTALHLTLILTYVHLRYIDEPTLSQKIEHHQTFMASSADYPYQFRVLLHSGCEAFIQLVEPLTNYRHAFLLYQISLRFITTFFAFLFFERYLRVWFTDPVRLIGILFLAAIHPLSYFNYHYQPSSCFTLMIFIMSMRLFYQQRWNWFISLLILETFNRFDTTFVLLCIYVLICDRQQPRNWLPYLLIYGSIWVIITGGLRWYFGEREYVHTVWFHITYNLKTEGSLLLFVLYGPLWYWAFKGWKSAPPFLKRASIIVPVYLIIYFLAAKVNEVRLFLPLATLIIPLALGYVFGWKMEEFHR